MGKHSKRITTGDWNEEGLLSRLLFFKIEKSLLKILFLLKI